MKKSKKKRLPTVEGVKLKAPKENHPNSLGGGAIVRDELIAFLLRCPPVIYASILDFGGVGIKFVVSKSCAKRIKPKCEVNQKS